MSRGIYLVCTFRSVIKLYLFMTGVLAGYALVV